MNGIRSGSSTNLHAEAMHAIIKCSYLTKAKFNQTIKDKSMMALQISPMLSGRWISLTRIRSEKKPGSPEFPSQAGKAPAEDFAPLAAVFRRRLLAGVGSASLVAVGANFAGITSFLLGFLPETGRGLKLDVLYPIGGYSRCLEENEGFEFLYPANWVRDQRLLYRAVGKEESERSLDPPPLNDKRPLDRPRNFNEPVVAFGPPGSNGELNVSVIVSPVALDFSIEVFGSPKEVGEAVIRKIAGSGRRPDISATLIDSTMREDPLTNARYYMLEFRVESSSLCRHNVAVCSARNGRLYTLNAQAPESVWPTTKEDFYQIANSFSLTSSS